MKKYTNTGSKDTRSGFGAGMTELGQKNERVSLLPVFIYFFILC